MELLSTFMKETYISTPDTRLPVKSIYDDFRAWLIAKLGAAVWNKINSKQVYSALKNFPPYVYARFREGYCLKGITYKSKDEVKQPLTLRIIPQDIRTKGPPRVTQMIVPKAFQN